MGVPCTASRALGATHDYSRVTLVFNVKYGEVDGVDISGLTVAAVADTPKVMTEGNWKLGLFIDDAASEEHAEKLGAVFSGGWARWRWDPCREGGERDGSSSSVRIRHRGRRRAAPLRATGLHTAKVSGRRPQRSCASTARRPRPRRSRRARRSRRRAARSPAGSRVAR
ncbi:MAG: DUF1326 domain-containing protein [Solirubrobacterales bacterium]|nr:DUF1326 domain-containing protein [Solirubrobacterales bacterium]